jgi:hypothetical protein
MPKGRTFGDVERVYLRVDKTWKPLEFVLLCRGKFKGVLERLAQGLGLCMVIDRCEALKHYSETEQICKSITTTNCQSVNSFALYACLLCCEYCACLRIFVTSHTMHFPLEGNRWCWKLDDALHWWRRRAHTHACTHMHTHTHIHTHARVRARIHAHS